MFVLGMNGAKRSGKDYAADVIIQEMKRRGYVVERTSFAKALRHCCMFITGCTPKDIDQSKDMGGRDFTVDIQLLMMWLRQRDVVNFGQATEQQQRDYEQVWCDAIELELVQQARNNSNFHFDFSADGMSYILHGSGRDLLIVIGQTARRIDPEFWVRRLAEELSPIDGANLNLFAIITDVRPQNEAKACDFVIEVQAPGVKFEGTATESRLPEHLRNISIENRMDASFANELRRFIPTLCKLVDGKNGDTPEMLSRRQYLTPELFNRAFLEVR